MTQFAFQTYTGNGSTTQYSISFTYIDSTHVKCFLDGVSTSAFSVSGSTVTFNSAPTNGAVIRIERQTPLTARLVDFQDGSVLTQADFTGDTGDIGDDSPNVGAGAYIANSDMVDSSKDTYILKMLARGVANARGYTGENPDLIVCPQEIYDMIENEIDPRKTGSKMSERMGSMGFTALNFRGIDIVADQDMVSQQDVADGSNDRYGYDGRIYFINTNYLHMFFNSGAKFTASDMVEDTKSNTFVQKVHTYGNMVVTNRRAHCVITGLEASPTYAPYG